VARFSAASDHMSLLDAAASTYTQRREDGVQTTHLRRAGVTVFCKRARPGTTRFHLMDIAPGHVA
jgi:hypothetical protein